MKRILIIGATSGIGEGLARWYANTEDVKIGVVGRREELLERLYASCPDVYEYAVCDVTDTVRAERVLEELTGKMGGLDLLILSAGTGHLNPSLDYVLEAEALELNVKGWTCLVDWAVRFFERQGYGHLVAITSVGGLRGSGVAPAYNATKAYQMNYLEGVRLRMAKNGVTITVTDIRPGLVDTAMAKGEGLFWVAPVEKVVRQIASGIKQKKNVWYVTRRWRIVAWFLKHVPDCLFMRMGG